MSNTSAAAIAMFGVDRAAPTCGLRINGGAAWTNVPTATLDLSGSADATSGLDVMAFSGDHSTWTAWETFNVTRVWTLTGGDGSKTLWARLRDHAGWVTECSQAIGLDTTPPTNVSITATPNGSTFALAWSADASLAGLHHYDVDVSVDSGAWQSVVANTTTTSASYPAQPGHSYTFRVTVTDNAGNVASAQTGAQALKRVTKYYAMGGKRVAMRTDGVVYYLHGDHLGSTSLVTNGAGDMVARQWYDAYGSLSGQVGTSPTDVGFTAQHEVASITCCSTGRDSIAARWGGSSARIRWCRVRGILLT